MRRYGLLLLATTSAWGGVLEVKRFTPYGDCNLDNVIPSLTEEDNCNIQFLELTAASDGPLATKACRFEAEVKVPPGYQIAADSMTLDGEFSVEGFEGEGIQLQTQYQMQGIGDAVTWRRESGDGKQNPSFDGPQAASFQLRAQAKQIAYGGCGQDVVFTGDLNIKAQGFGNFINLDQQTAEWRWRVRPCGRVWNSTYRAQGGFDVQATIRWQGSEGTYTLDSGQVGQFYQVRYGEDVIEGLWQFGHTRGWFQFYLDDARTSFSGHWGYGPRIGVQPRAHWGGSLAQIP